MAEPRFEDSAHIILTDSLRDFTFISQTVPFLATRSMSFLFLGVGYFLPPQTFMFAV